MTIIAWNKRTNEEVDQIVCKLGYIFIKEYMNKNHRRVVIQDEIGYKYDVDLYNLIEGHIPYFVGANNPYSLENIALWLSLNRPEFKLSNNNIYTIAKGKLIFYHITCEEYFQLGWDSILHGQGCSICSGHQVGKYNNLAYKFSEIAKEWHPTKNNELTPDNVAYGSGQKVWWLCSKGHEYYSSIASRTNVNSGCPICSSSHGELRIQKFLENNRINYISQKKFQDCRNINELPFDFGIPYDDGSWKCLEYWGIQHLEPVDFFGGEEQFKLQKKLDKIKQKYCKDNNIPLIIIPYWEFDNVEKILSDILL